MWGQSWRNLWPGDHGFFFFFSNLLGWYWLIKLHRFQVYKSTIRHLYIVLRVHHPKSSLLPSPFIPALPSSNFPHPVFPLVITILMSVSMRLFLLNPFCYREWGGDCQGPHEAHTSYFLTLLCYPMQEPEGEKHSSSQSQDSHTPQQRKSRKSDFSSVWLPYSAKVKITVWERRESNISRYIC